MTTSTKHLKLCLRLGVKSNLWVVKSSRLWWSLFTSEHTPALRMQMRLFIPHVTQQVKSKENKKNIFLPGENWNNWSHIVKNGARPHEPCVVFDLFLSRGCLYEDVKQSLVREPVNNAAAGRDVTCSFWSKPGLEGSACWYQSGWEITTRHCQSLGNLGCGDFNFK